MAPWRMGFGVTPRTRTRHTSQLSTVLCTCVQTSTLRIYSGEACGDVIRYFFCDIILNDPFIYARPSPAPRRESSPRRSRDARAGDTPPPSSGLASKRTAPASAPSASVSRVSLYYSLCASGTDSTVIYIQYYHIRYMVHSCQTLRKIAAALTPPPRAAFMAPAAAPPSEADLGLGAPVRERAAARRAAAAAAPVAAGAKLGRPPRSSSLAPSPTPYLEPVRVWVGGRRFGLGLLAGVRAWEIGARESRASAIRNPSPTQTQSQP